MQLKFLLSRAAPYRSRILLVSLLSILNSLAILAVPWLAGQLIGGIFQGASLQGAGYQDMGGQFTAIIGLLVLVLIAITVLRVTATFVSADTSARILADLRVESYAHIQGLPLGFHDRSSQGDILALMTYEVASLSSFLSDTLANAPSMLLTAGGAVLLLFLIDPTMALFVPVLVLVFFIVMRLIGRRLRVLARKVRKVEAGVMGMAESDLDLLPAIKAFAVEDDQRARYAGLVDEARVLSLREMRIYAVLSPAIGLIAALAAIAVIVIGNGQFSAGDKSATELFSFLFYAALLTSPVGQLGDVYGRFQTARGTLSRLQAVFDQPLEPGYTASGTMLDCSGAVTFDNITFGYRGRGETLRGLNLDIPAGETIALTGENGVGKSTMISLLLRFYEPTAGVISIDGRDISTIQVQELRRLIGYVPQRPLLFNGSVRENIAFGLSDASEAQIDAATRLSQAHEFIANLPQGLDTQIGDHGVRLSGGQRQRIALARALIVDPPILIFDEATAMYDLEGEAAFIEACHGALDGRTVILVTHRTASLALADRVVIVEDGVIAASGFAD